MMRSSSIAVRMVRSSMGLIVLGVPGADGEVSPQFGLLGNESLAGALSFDVAVARGLALALALWLWL
jgi:hypothetical protein